MLIKYIPVITVDGLTASGKGTVAKKTAQYLGFHYLDSGVLYRLVALLVIRNKVNINNEFKLTKIAQQLHYNFDGLYIYLNDENVTQVIQEEKIGNLASKIAVFYGVRNALYNLQLSFCKPPGLVADGRDMGTTIFPHAALKIYLTATLAVRAKRRYHQLRNKGFSVKLKDLLKDLEERDKRDASRTCAPLRPAKAAYLLDTSHISINEMVKRILGWYKSRV